MDFDLSLDGVSFSSDPEDAELAGHVKGVAEATRDLATYVAGESRQTCHACGETRTCRPLALQDDSGQPVKAPTCAECQTKFVDQRLSMARDPDGDLPVDPEEDDDGV